MQIISVATIFPSEILAHIPKPKPGCLLRLQPKDVVTKELIINIRVSNLKMVQAAILANADEIKKLIGKHIEIVAKHKGPING